MSNAQPDWDLAPRAYEAIAAQYDQIPRTNRINAYMRAASLRTLLRTFKPGDRLLELGCGTGDEAIELARRDISIVAVDPSERMVLQGREKADAAGLDGRITFLRGMARNLAGLGLEQYGPFSGGFASFSLAYEPHLRPIAAELHRLLAGTSVFLSSLPSRVCAAELALSFMFLRPSFAGRRLGAWYPHKVETKEVPIRAYTSQSVARAMSPFFRLERTLSLAALLPPAYMNRYYQRFRGFTDALESLDKAVNNRVPFKYLGDHLLAVLRRNDLHGG